MRKTEWPTLVVFAVTYVSWVVATMIWDAAPVLSFVIVSLAIAQYSSLSHEVLHGHPFRQQALNEALVFPGLTLYVPYLRFRDTHLKHHHDPDLTDPYDDPESNFQDPALWAKKSALGKLVLRMNNTLLGRIILGPALSIWSFGRDDLKLILAGDRSIALAWGLHGIGVAMVILWLVTVATMPVWVYVIAAYAGFGLLKIRTFLEHRAHDLCRARTVIIESRGPLSLLFLNNNFHAVHHMHPQIPWYELPKTYAARKEHYQRRVDGYVFRNYADIFRQFLFKAKDPVPHPIWPVKKTGAMDEG